jgi:rubrerythrin
MISISSATAFMLYLALTLAAILGIWIYHHFLYRKKKILPSAQELFICEYCQYVYLEESQKKITQCPQCQLFNKRQ